MAQIRGICEGDTSPVVLAFLDSTIVYNAADLIGSNRIRYPPSIRIVPVPTTARIGVKHLLYAFAVGADGIFLGDSEKEAGSISEATEITEKRLEIFFDTLEKYEIDIGRLRFSSLFIPEFKKLADLFDRFSTRIQDLGAVKNEVRKRIRKGFIEGEFEEG